MRALLCISLTVLVCFTAPSVGLFEDQIGKFDWMKRGVGSVKFAEFDTSGNADGAPARRLVVATEHNVVAVLNTKNGEIIWRQVQDAGPSGTIESLALSGNGEILVVSGNPPLLRSFDINTAAVTSEVIFGLPFVHLPEYGRRVVRHVGTDITIAHLTQGSVRLTRVDTASPTSPPLTLHITQPWISPELPCGLTSSTLVCVDASLGLVLHLPLHDWGLEEPPSPLAFASTPLQSIGLGAPTSPQDGDCPPRLAPMAVSPVHGNPQLLVIKSGVLSVLVKGDPDGVVSVTSPQTDVMTSPSLAASEDDEVTYVATQQKQVVHVSAVSADGSESDGLSVPIATDATVRQVTVQQFRRRSDGQITLRALIVMDDESVHLAATSGVLWSREEALASVMAVEAVDLPVSASSVSIHDTLQKSDILGGVIQRLVVQSSLLLQWVAEVLEGTLSSPPSSMDGGDGPPSLTRDEFNLHKLLVVVTEPGKLFALDNWSGAIVWSVHLPTARPLPTGRMMLFLQRSVAHFPLPPLMTLVAMAHDSCQGLVYTFNPLTGEEAAGGLTALPYRISQASLLHQHDQHFVKPVLLVDASLGVHVVPATAEATVLLPHKHVLYVNSRNATALSGYSLRASKPGSLILTQVWSAQFGTIMGVYAKRPGDRVMHSSGRVMYDRSVLYKYNNPNLAVVTAKPSDNKRGGDTLNVYLVDLVSGAVVDCVHHKSTSGPVHVMHSENWVVYTYYHDTHRRHEVHSLELFEGAAQSNSSAFSSVARAEAGAPIVERQAFVLPYGVQAASVTVTERGITSKYLLMALANGGVVQVARWLVDPRRPMSGGGPREEGLMPYVPEVPLPPTEVISYNQSLPRVTGVFSAPTGLESTCIVFVYGLDLFFSQVFPSKMFDMLKDDFDHLLIVAVLTGLGAAAVITRKLAQRKALHHLWK